MYMYMVEWKSLNLTCHCPGSLRSTVLNLADNQQALMMRFEMSPRGKKKPKAYFALLIYIAGYAKFGCHPMSYHCLIPYKIILLKRGWIGLLICCYIYCNQISYIKRQNSAFLTWKLFVNHFYPGYLTGQLFLLHC